MAGNLATVDDFKKVIAALIENSMIHRGEEFNQSTCDDFSAHTLYQLHNTGPQKFANYVPEIHIPDPDHPLYGTPSAKDLDLEPVIPFKCTFAVQKSSIGWDYMNAIPVMYYRNGCYCESHQLHGMAGGCPFQIHDSPSYQFFGFSAATERVVTPSKALCWYWSTPTHPEWGYLWNVKHGYSYQAPLKNGTDLQNEWNDLRKKKIKERKEAEGKAF
jgi:hypothetical protein